MKYIFNKWVKADFGWSLLAMHLIFFVLLLWVYKTYIVDIYGYMGYSDLFNFNKALLSIPILIAAYILLRNNGLPSYFFLNLIIATTVTPSLVIFSGSDLPYSFIIVTWIAFAILVIVARFSKLPRLKCKRIRAKIILYWFAGLSLLYIASLFAFGGGKFLNFNFLLVYEIRKARLGSLPGFYGYLMPNFSKAIIPIGLVIALFYRKWAMALIFILCSVMIFALTGHKGPLFIPFFIIFIYWASCYFNVTNITLLALIMLVVIGGMDFYLRQSGIEGLWGWVGNLGIRRSLLVPCYLNWAYYDFFSVNPSTYWADSKLSLGLIQSPYDLGISKLIGREVLNSNAHANTGWIGSGMANAGYFGAAIYSAGLGLLLSLIDVYAKKHGYKTVMAIFLISVTAAARSTDLPNMLLTHGLSVLLFVVIVIKFVPKKNTVAK